ncbi:MAG: dihydrodipicolinate synthase family protein [Bryobacteraceae bacterium]
MKPLSAAEIMGTWATLLLPIAPDDSIDFERLAEVIDKMLAAGVDGIYSNGTACEFFTQTESEYDRIHDLLAERCERARMPFQVGASHPSPQTMRERVRRAVVWKPSGIQVTLPDWVPVNNREAIRFLSSIAALADPIPLVLYNPPHAKRVLQPADLGALRQAVPALAGIKVVPGGDDWYAAMRLEAPGLSIFVPGHELATGIRMGAAGSYSNVACLSPSGAAWWNRLMYSDPGRALEVEGRIQAFMKQHVLPFRLRHGVSNPALDKLLATAGGWTAIGTRLRWPYDWVPEEEAIRLRPVVREMVPELFQV